MLPVSPRIDSSISSREMSRCESVLLPPVPSSSARPFSKQTPSSPPLLTGLNNPIPSPPLPLLPPTIPHVQTPHPLTSSRTHRTPHHRRASRVPPPPPSSRRIPKHPTIGPKVPTRTSPPRAAQLYAHIEHLETAGLLLSRSAIPPSVTRAVKFYAACSKQSHRSRSPAWPRAVYPIR